MLSCGDPQVNQVVRPCLPGARSHRQRETGAVVKTGMASAARRNAGLGGGGRYSDRYSLKRKEQHRQDSTGGQALSCRRPSKLCLTQCTSVLLRGLQPNTSFGDDLAAFGVEFCCHQTKTDRTALRSQALGTREEAGWWGHLAAGSFRSEVCTDLRPSSLVPLEGAAAGVGRCEAVSAQACLHGNALGSSICRPVH